MSSSIVDSSSGETVDVGPNAAPSEISKDRQALSAALAAADRLAKLAGTIPLVNRTRTGNRTES